MRREEIRVRDPYILVHEERYYLYGTRSETCWGPADGFDCYISADLEQWEGPVEIFHRPEGFWADQCYWAPECYAWKGRFCLVTTLAGGRVKKGVHTLWADRPEGPFTYGARLTPEGWTCIDGTLYLEGTAPWLIFSHSFEDAGCRDMCALRLKDDLSGPAGDPVPIFQVSEAPWCVPVPFAKEEFGMDGEIYFSDGPCAVKLGGGALSLLWSGWGAQGYCVGQAISESGAVTGPWRQLAQPLFPRDGGHGMLFTALDGRRYYVLHAPNTKGEERPVLFEVEERDGVLALRPDGRDRT